MDTGPIRVHIEYMPHFLDFEGAAARLVDELAGVEGHERVALPHFPYRP
jgi:hypothetical protein